MDEQVGAAAADARGVPVCARCGRGRAVADRPGAVPAQ